MAQDTQVEVPDAQASQASLMRPSHGESEPVCRSAVVVQSPAGADPGPLLVVSKSSASRLMWLAMAAVAAVLSVVPIFSMVGGGHHSNQDPASLSPEAALDSDDSVAIAVNTVFPRQKTLVRTLTQPGSVHPSAEAELYAKVSGYLQSIQRDPSPQMVAELVAQQASAASMAPTASPLALAALSAVSAQVAHEQAPQKDIGSYVKAGDVLLVIASPERLQEIVERESLLQQREAEMEQARTVVTTCDAAIAQARADLKRCESDSAYYTKQLARFRDLVKRLTITAEVAEEKQHQLEAAQAACDTARANIAVASSKHATAKADLRVKETLVQVAHDELRQAQILADYAYIQAPFDGIITYRGVDEGDFVQNSASGQTRLLMTVTAIDKVKVVLQVPEREAVWVRAGADATLELDSRPGWLGKGRVSRIAHTIEAKSRTMQVEIDLDNKDHRLLPGMYGQATVALQKIPGAFAVPATAVYSRKGSNYILQVHDGGVRRHPVRIRFDDGKELEVVKLIGGKEVPLGGTEELIVSNKGEIAEGQHVHSSHPNGD